MKWLEIIEFRSVNSDRSYLEQQLNSLIKEINTGSSQGVIEVYNRLTVESDFSIHLFHDSEEADINGSQLGLRLVSALREFGLVNHSVWIEQRVK